MKETGRRALRIALGQLASTDDVEANLRAIDDAAGSAAADGAELLLLPEYATFEKAELDADCARVAEPLDGPVATRLAATARRHGLFLVAGVLEAGDGPAGAYNTLVAFGPDGGLLASYRKAHLFDAQGYAESDFIDAAPEPEAVVVELAGVRCGLMICYDLRFPEHARALSDAGAQVLLVAASWVPGRGKLAQWQALLAARAIENGMFVAGACQAVPHSVGHSALVDPMGTGLAGLGPAAGLALADADLRRIASTRRLFPMHRQRRFS
ncbi:nitrilase-related carbon-nitrogen hydrolase [Zafaria sp. Z1313]|uniref:nitrilase-related carbon-nitrogen hydrolase n=1 Tax=unclassified Zafaria TaxID=2828765 RepID=UPI002E77FA31|nr:nitrilase-related carbon-nitrogen hydrolase [Zafaria sp. J156]MEE1621911.1 nitrilase-related carbon-nitrogen hydrolase [Zafaria sp. J156]